MAKPVDFRKGAEGVAALVREMMKADPFSGAVYVFRAKRADWVKRCKPPAPARLIEGGLPTEATVAHVLVSKYADHLPLYRQAQIYA